MPHAYALANSHKESFADIYNLPTPIEYFTAMNRLGYEIPDNAAPIFYALIGELRRRQHPVRVVDLGCSYGINAALLKYGLTMHDLYARYTAAATAALPRKRLISEDRAWLSRRVLYDGLTIYGLDQADNAIGYAVANGLLDEGAAVDLETAEIGPITVRLPDSVDLIISTGCVGYVTERTFARLLDASSGQTRPWIASFVLRIFDYESIAQTLARRGYVTERLEGSSFVQRRFVNEAEAQHTLRQLSLLGRNPAGLETTGRLYADLFLSRPMADTAEVPLCNLLPAFWGERPNVWRRRDAVDSEHCEQ